MMKAQLYVYNKHCITELILLDNTKVLSLFDTGSISDSQ